MRKLTQRSPDKPLKILGFDVVWEYKFPIRHILELTQEVDTWKERETLKNLLQQPALEFSVWGKQKCEVSTTLKEFVKNYLANQKDYEKYVRDPETFNYLITNIDHNFQEEF